MSTIARTRNPVKPIRRRESSPAPAPPTVEQIIASTPVASATIDPWYEDRTPRPAPPEWLVYGARVRHTLIPGTWKVVRSPARYGNGQDWLVRVREQADDGSLVGPVLSWKVGEVAGLAGDEAKVEAAEVRCDNITPDPPAPAAVEPRPLVVAMAISIDGHSYNVTPLAPAPDATKAYRFERILRRFGEGVYDLDETATGASCDCPDFVFRRDGLDPLGCKHIRSARMLGLFADAPEPAARQVEAAPCCDPIEPAACTACVPDGRAWDPTVGVEEDEDPRYGPQDDGGGGWDAYDDSRWTITPDSDPTDDEDREVAQLIEDGALEQAEGEGPLADATAECFAAVAEGRADWTREFGWVPSPGFVTPANLADLLAEDAIDEGWASRPRGYSRGLLAEAGKGALVAPFAEPDPRTLAEQIDVEARHYRTLGTAFGDLMAETIAKLAAEVRYLDAETPDGYRDRKAAMLDAELARIEARAASRCC